MDHIPLNFSCKSPLGLRLCRISGLHRYSVQDWSLMGNETVSLLSSM